jgi:hypothetical protein
MPWLLGELRQHNRHRRAAARRLHLRHYPQGGEYWPGGLRSGGAFCDRSTRR